MSLLPFVTEFRADFSTFTPGDHQGLFVDRLLDQVIALAAALAPLRSDTDSVPAAI